MDYTFWFVNWFSFLFSIILLVVIIINLEKLGVFSGLLVKLALVLIVISFVVCLYTTSSRKKVGATCEDGWQSYSKGQGTCSHHGGVEHWNYKYWFD